MFGLLKASMTKALTATAAMQLVEQGKLKLETTCRTPGGVHLPWVFSCGSGRSKGVGSPRDRIDVQSFIWVVGDYKEDSEQPQP